MADEGYGRTFAGDPNAPPKPPTPPAVRGSTSSAAAPVDEEGGAGPAPAAATEQSAPAKNVYRVSAGEDGRSSVYRMSADLETTNMGQVTVNDAADVLHAVGQFNPVTQSWTVPEDAAMKLIGGRLPLPAYLEAKWAGGESAAVRGLIGKAYLDGRMTPEDARERGNAELLKNQLNEAPVFAWQGGFGPTVAKMWKDLNEAGASGVARRVAGEVASAAPDLLGMMGDASQMAAVMGAGGAALGATVGGPAAPATAAAGATAMGGVGFAYGMFKHVFDVSAGNTALDMLDKGFDPKTIGVAAPVAGAINGVLMVGQVKFMTASLQRTFLKNVLASETVKGAMARYVTEVAGGTSMSAAQRAVDIAVNDISAQVDNRPDLTTPAPISEIVNAAVTAAPVMGVFGLPGAALEVKGAMKGTEMQGPGTGKQMHMVTAAQAEGGAAPKAETFYHGTTHDISQPEGVFWMTQDPKAASGYADRQAFANRATEGEDYRSADQYSPKYDEVGPSGQRVLRVNADIKKPLDLRDAGQTSSVEKIAALLHEKGIIEKLDDETLDMISQDLSTEDIEVHPRTKIPVYRALEGLDAYKDIEKAGFDGIKIVDTDVHGAPVDAVAAFHAEKQVRMVNGDSSPVPAKPFESVDPKGDYFGQRPAEKLQAAVEKADSGKASPAELQKAVDDLTAQGPKTYGEKVVEVERKAHVASLKDELAATETQMKALEAEKARYEKAGMGTKVLDRKLEALNEEATRIKGDVEFHTNIGPRDLMIEEKQKLLMSPSTLEAAVNIGFTEGRKEVLDVRRKQVLDVAERLDLTPAELREAMGTRNYGALSDAQFDHWFNGAERKGAERQAGFVDKAKALTRERFARENVVQTLKDREISGERNIRALHDLPSVHEMTEKQLNDFVDIINTYEKGSKVLTPKAVEALSRGSYAQARTMQDVLRLAAEKQKRPIEELMGARRDQFDYLRGDVALAEKHPLYAAVVDPVQQARARAAATHEAWREVNTRLGAEALASRGNAVGRFLDPTMPEVFKHLETDPALIYAGQVDPATLPHLTPAEVKYVDFLRDSFRDAREYLRLTGELEKSRFENSYFPHVQQSLLEAIKAIPEKGVKKALRDMLAGIANSYEKLTVPQASGDPNAFGYKKFFKQTLFRSGDVAPSKEVMRVADNYMRDFIEKRELDIAAPEAMTLARSVLALETDKSPDAVAARKSVERFIKDFLNNKKGINMTFENWAPRGGLIDVGLRAASSFISFSRIALNLPLELTAPIGENLAATQVTGHVGYLKAQARMLTAEGRAFLKNNEAFTGKGQVETLFEPGRNAEQRAATVMYGALQFGRTHALKSILMALATDAEIKAGKMSPARLAEIERQTGRWVDIHGMKSIVGSTTPGAAYTKFRTWMLPIMRSVAQDLKAGADSLRGKKAMTSQQKWELVAAAFNTSVAAVAMYAVKPDDEDKSASANVRRRGVSELFSILQGANPVELLKPGPVVKFYDDLYTNLMLTIKLEKYKHDSDEHEEGDLKGPPALKRQLVPAMWRQFESPKEK